jgi:hypothetical protein
MKTVKNLDHFTFRVLACLAVVCLLAGRAQAQLTNNPLASNTTNTTALVPIGTNGFGVALLGYPMPNWVGGTFFANQLDGVALSDASTAPESGYLQFYAANHEDIKATGTNLDNIVGYRILQPTSNPNQLTVYRSWVASIQTNSTPVAGASAFGGACAGSTGLSGVSKKGTIVFRLDGSSAPASPNMPGECFLVLPAQVTATTIITNALVPIVVNGVAMTSNVVLAIDSNTGNIAQIGQNSDLVVKNSFAGFSYACRSNITPASAGANSWSTNAQAIVGASGLTAAGQAVNPVIVVGSTFNTRATMGINDTAKLLTTFVKTAADLATGGDSMTGLGVLNYTDAGGAITPSGFHTNVFGATSATPGGITTNGTYFFSRTAFGGPAAQSINDTGAVAFAVGINVDGGAGSVGNNPTNGTRASQIMGIIYMQPGTSNFLKVCDNTDPTLFWQAPVACTNKNLISQPALDNYGNVYFEAYCSGNPAFSCDLFPTSAVYQAVANDKYNPTAWTVRILLRQGDTFTNTVSGDVFQVYDLPYNNSVSANVRTTTQRSFGPSAINRTQLPGHTVGNTVPSDPFAVGGILVQASLTNLTQGIRTDGLLYVAPYTQSTALPFVINSVTRVGNGININWNGQVGSNIVQASSGDASGGYTNSYTDLTNVYLTTSVVTNYTDANGATNNPSQYYRIKSVP